MIYSTADGKTSRLHVDIGLPYMVPSGRSTTKPSWACQYRTRGFARDELLTVYGADGVQALYMALQIAGVRIASQPESIHLDWASAVNFGFPPVVTPQFDREEVHSS
jgi:hypothetical protein